MPAMSLSRGLDTDFEISEPNILNCPPNNAIRIRTAPKIKAAMAMLSGMILVRRDKEYQL